MMDNKKQIEQLMLYHDDDLHQEPLNDIARRRFINELVIKSRDYEPNLSSSSSGSLKSPGFGMKLAASAAAVVICLVAIWILWPSKTTSVAEDFVDATISSPKVEVISGSVSLGRIQHLAAGDRVDLTQTLSTHLHPSVLALTPEVLLLLNKYTSVRLDRGDSDRVNVFVERGAILVSAKPGGLGSSFSVSTLDGKVTVTGTIFGVAVRNQRTWVELFEGSLMVEDAGRKRFLEGSSYLVMGGGDPQNLDAARRRTVIEIASIMESSQAKDTPSSSWSPAFFYPTMQVAKLQLPDIQPDDNDGQVVLKKGSDKKRTVGENKEAQTQSQPTSDDLFKKAQAARRSRDWKLAADTYRQLIDLYPVSSNARIALVSLASVQLRQLGRPAAALANFERYLSISTGGSLATEATWGRACALRSLGNVPAEKAALKRFISEYPSSFQAFEAKQRLTQLQSN